MGQRYYIAMDDDGKAFIAHHGIKGQKWGVRRFQDSNGELTAAGRARYNTDSAYKTEKSLNRIERQNMKLKTKAAIADAKANKAYSKGNDKRSQKYKSVADEARKAMRSGDALSNRLIRDAGKKVYDVRSTSKTRYAHKGRMILSTMLAGPTGALTVAAVDAYRANAYGAEAGGIVQSKKYNVYRT
jgi:hypothetical protein